MKAVKANLIILNKRCEFVYDEGNAWAPMGHYRVADLAERMNALCGESAVIEFRSSDRHEAEDKAKFRARLNQVGGWTFSDWQPQVVRGHVVSAVWQCVATRDESAASGNVVELRADRDRLVRELESVQASCGNGHSVKKLVRLSAEIEAIENKLSECAS